MENKNKIYLHDRWYYLINDTDSKLVYSSIPGNQDNAITVILDKKTYEIIILNMKKGNTFFKISSTNIKKDIVDYNLKEIVPQQLDINENTYVNLIIESNIKYKMSRMIDNNIIISKKRIMRKICYCEPTFALNVPLQINDLDINSNSLDFFLGIIESISIKKNNLISYIEDVKEKEVIDIKNEVKSLNIPSEVYFYDRNYKLIKSDTDTIYYSNDEDSYNELNFKYDPIYKNLTGIDLLIKENKTTKVPNYVLKIKKDKLGNKTIKFESIKKVKLYLSDELLENAQFKCTLEFDSNYEITSFNTKINYKKTTYNLTPNPIFKGVYSDELGKEYRLIDKDYSYLLGIAKLSSRGFDHYEKVLAKEI